MAIATQPAQTLAETAPAWAPTGNHSLDALFALTYTIPTLRLLARGFRPILPHDIREKFLDIAPDSPIGRFNEKTGEIDKTISTWRALLVPLLTYFYSSYPTAMSGAAVIGSVLAALDHSHRIEADLIRHQMQAGTMITIRSWEAYENRALGVFGCNTPETFTEADLLKNNPIRYGEGVSRTPSRFAFYKGLYNSVSTIWGLAVRTAVHAEGLMKTVANGLKVVFSGKEVSPSLKFTQAVGYALSYWAQKQAQAYKMNVESHGFEALEAVPQGIPICHAVYGHTMWTNYILFGLRHLMRFMADIGHFRNNPIAKITSFSWLMDMLALPPAIRKSSKDTTTDAHRQTRVLQQAVNNIKKLGIEPTVFVQGGRIPRSYHDDGALDIPTMYDNVTKLYDKEKQNYYPERYDNLFSVIKMAKAAAAQTHEQTAFISTIDILGGTWIDPKFSNSFPFVQPIIEGGTIDFRHAGGFYVTPDTPDQEIIDRVHKLIRDYTRVDQYLAQLASEWAAKSDLQLRKEDIARLIEADERYAIIIARIRCIPPQKALSERNEMKRGLIALIREGMNGNRNSDAIQDLLLKVSQLVKEYEYDQSIPLKLREAA